MNDTYRNLLLLRDAGLVVVLIVAWLAPGLGSRFLAAIEKSGSRLGRYRGVSVLGAAILVLILRLSILPWIPAPAPQSHDEFSYLLAADTFAHGRIANPPHPMWVFFETFHVNQLPTYASKYPPGQGAVLAMGEVLGHPWIGVLVSVAGLCAAITWALQGWMSSRWALLGGILAVTQFGAINYWMESYWGGAVAAIGGALMIGAFPRILRCQRVRDSLLFATGVGVLANTRPYEGCLFTVILMVALGWQLLHRPKIKRGRAFLKVGIPMITVLFLVAAFIGYYNWRVTGSPALLPYTVNNRAYLGVPIFQWERLGPPHPYYNPQFESFYNLQRMQWSQEHFSWTWSTAKTAFLAKLDRLQGFYAPPELGLPILVALFSLSKNKTVLFCAVVCAVFIGGLLALLWTFPHYAAPFTATVYILILLGFRSLRRWTIRGRSSGVGMTRALVLFHVFLFVAQIVVATVWLHGVAHRETGWAQARAQIESKLQSTPGQHLVLVEYSRQHDPNQEWVFNRAEIDRTKVVWARVTLGRDITPLLNYFRGRALWVLEPDATSGPRLKPFAVTR